MSRLTTEQVLKEFQDDYGSDFLEPGEEPDPQVYKVFSEIIVPGIIDRLTENSFFTSMPWMDNGIYITVYNKTHKRVLVITIRKDHIDFEHRHRGSDIYCMDRVPLHHISQYIQGKLDAWRHF